MDKDPHSLNQNIIALASANPKIKEIVNLYLHEVPVNEGVPLTWENTLEMMVLKLAELYASALEGLRDEGKIAKLQDISKEMYDPGLEVPIDVVRAAYFVANYAKMQGWERWVIGPCADRSLVNENEAPKATT